MKKTANKLEEQFEALNLSLNQKTEFVFRLHENRLFLSNFDFLIPPIITHYIVLFSEPTNLKYIKLKSVSDKNTYKPSEVTELTENKYLTEIKKINKNYGIQGRQAAHN